MVTQDLPEHGHTHGHPAEAHTGDHAHPGPVLYIKIAVVLAIITVVEVFILYLPDMGVEAARPFLVPAFAVLSIAKFLFVVAYYMHLKFDDPFYLRMFAFALVIGISLVTAFVAIFHGHGFGLGL